MNDYVATQLIQARRQDIERGNRHSKRRRERSWSALAAAHAVRFGLAGALAAVGAQRPAPNELRGSS